MAEDFIAQVDVCAVLDSSPYTCKCKCIVILLC